MEQDGHMGRRGLNDAQGEQFVHDGFVRLENAFPPEVAAEARAILWREMGCDPEDRESWRSPVIRLGDFAQEPFRQAVNTAALHAAFDNLVGVGQWIARESLGGFVIRFPHPEEPEDTGWHVDASFPADLPSEAESGYFDWRVNLQSKGRALLMLFLFSDVGEKDAPTRIRVGSHLRVPPIVASAGEGGLPMMELSLAAAGATEGMPEVLATGPAGTVYLCHPFLVHAAQSHHGAVPRFLAQPPLLPRVPFELTRSDGNYSLVERAIRLGLGA